MRPMIRNILANTRAETDFVDLAGQLACAVAAFLFLYLIGVMF